MKVLLNNYHTHTSRCGHATGNDEDYIKEAIKHGMKSIGISDHIPLAYHESFNGRMDFEVMDDYLKSVKTLKEKYKDQIIIYTGFESEAIIKEKPFYERLLNEGIVDYLILGAHMIDYASYEDAMFFDVDSKKVERYTNHCLKMMESGLYIYLAHPDLYMKKYPEWNEQAAFAAELICRKSKELNFPIEINCEGMRGGIQSYLNGKVKRYVYPVREFWEIAAEHQCPVIIGVDAHNPEDINSESVQIALQWAEELKLNLVKDNKLLDDNGKIIWHYNVDMKYYK